MSAARKFLPLLLTALLLAGCDEFSIAPPADPDPGDPGDTIDVEAPASLWERSIGEHADQTQTFLAAGTGGTLYLTANTSFGTSVENQARVILLDPQTGDPVTHTSVTAEDLPLRIAGVAPSIDDSAFVFGSRWTGGQEAIAYRILPDGRTAWSAPLRINRPGLHLVGGEPLPEGELLLYGQLGDESARFLWLARIAADGTIRAESDDTPYPGHALKDVTYVVDPTSPQGGSILMLRWSQTCPPTGTPGNCEYKGYVDPLDPGTLSPAGEPIPITPDFQELNYEHIIGADNGDVYLVGSYKSPERDLDVVVTRLETPSINLPPRSTTRAFGGAAVDAPWVVTSTGDGLLIAGSTADSASWPNSPGAKSYFLIEVEPEMTPPWIVPFGRNNAEERWQLTDVAFHPDFGYYVAGTRDEGQAKGTQKNRHFVLRYAHE